MRCEECLCGSFSLLYLCTMAGGRRRGGCYPLCPEERGFPGPAPSPLPFPWALGWQAALPPQLPMLGWFGWLLCGCGEGSLHAVPMKTGSPDHVAMCFSTHNLSYGQSPSLGSWVWFGFGPDCSLCLYEIINSEMLILEVTSLVTELSWPCSTRTAGEAVPACSWGRGC